MKALFIVLTMALATQAQADFLSLPIKCQAVHGLNGFNADQVSVTVTQPGDSPVVALVKDHDDASRMLCQNTGSGTLECSGRWIKDLSVSHLTLTLNTFVPFVHLQRSTNDFQGEVITGLCIE